MAHGKSTKRSTMKVYITLLVFGCSLLVLQSCSDDPVLDDMEIEEAIDEVVVPDVEEEIVEVETETPKPATDYHITLNKGKQHFESGLGGGEVVMADDFICTVNDWKMRVLTEQFDPHQMVGNMYDTQITSNDFSSRKCECEITSVMGTGIKNEIGEYVKAEGTITCDDDKVKGSFRIKLISPGG